MKKQQSYQVKIGLSLAVFLVGVLVLFLFVYPWLLSLLQGKLTTILEQKKTVLELRQEQKNIELAKQDLEELRTKTLAPEDLFSRDIKIVPELAALEAKAKEFNTALTLSVTGTLATAAKAKTTSDLYAIPFSLQLEGSFGNVISYIEFLEHAASIMTVRTVSVSAGTQNSVNTTLGGTLYLRK